MPSADLPSTKTGPARRPHRRRWQPSSPPWVKWVDVPVASPLSRAAANSLASMICWLLFATGASPACLDKPCSTCGRGEEREVYYVEQTRGDCSPIRSHTAQRRHPLVKRLCLAFALRHARPCHTLPVKRALRFRHGSARTTLRCDASNGGPERIQFQQALHRGAGCAG
jgi:hypothetical protein